MFPTHDPLSVLNYGQIHVLELGLAIGLLAATVYRSDRYAAYAILGLSVGIIPLQALLQAVPEVTVTTVRIARNPLLFTVPMALAFSVGVTVPPAVRSRFRRDDSPAAAERPEQPAD